MAEERTLGLARARDFSDRDAEGEPSKEELQRRMDEARDSITNTVTEIKDTVVNQYQSVKETINETLDWREHFRKRPLVWSAAALGLGAWTGYCIAGAIKGEGDIDDDRLASMRRVNTAPRTSPAARFANTPQDSATDNGRAEAAEPERPGLFERFRETAAYDRLEREVSSLGSRFVEELSKTAHEVVLPALLVKLKDLIGMDLSARTETKEGRLLSNNRAGGADREVYGARPSSTQAAAAGAGQTYEAQHGKADRGSGGSALPRPSEVNA
jgi:hypothetical protein